MLETIYDKIMNLKIFIDSGDIQLIDMYKAAVEKHNKKIQECPDIIDAGFDLYAPLGQEWNQELFFKLDFKIICSAQIKNYSTNKTYNTGYYLYPRSSISKTNLRLANSVGIIDAGYRGHIMAVFDINNNNNIYVGKAYERYVQICAPGLIPITVEIVNSIEELGEKTERGEGGFGSTGQ